MCARPCVWWRQDEKKSVEMLEGHGSVMKGARGNTYFIQKEPEYSGFYFQNMSAQNVDTFALLHLLNSPQAFAFHIFINLLLPEGLIGIRGLC